MKRYLIIVLSSISLFASAQSVSQQRMQQIYDESRTPYKYGLVVAPTTNKAKIDCPSVFREGDAWYMTYVLYNGKDGGDGRGYETWLAKSSDLLHWSTLGRVLAYPESGWDLNQRAGYPALQDINWNGSYELQKYKGKHWMSYFGGIGTGYEAVRAPLSIGMAFTKDDITKPHQWETFPHHVMSYDDKDAQWWEQITQYKSIVYWDRKEAFGYPFVMFYNAAGKDAIHPKAERIGIALSKDMEHWVRYAGNPVFAHDVSGLITGDAHIQRFGDVYVMFYYCAFNPKRRYKAYNTFAASYDLVHWTDWDGADLIYPSKSYDEMFAHKSFLVKHNGVVYHYYCAVNNSGQRGIAVATSRQMGKSEVTFPEPDPTGCRITMSLNKGWRIGEQTVDVPYNLDDYYGACQLEHGNLHGDTTFTKSFDAPDVKGKEYFIRFEGIGTYADITLNNVFLGHYAVGRTTLTVDITKAVKTGKRNLLAVRVSHPSGITDMPWVCGGCSSEWGFSEGSQPFGIFRPVTLEITDKVRVEPFGTHVWNNMAMDSLFVETELHNYADTVANVNLITKICDGNGLQKIRLSENIELHAGEIRLVKQSVPIKEPHLWSIEDPYLYTLNNIIKRNDKATDDCTTPFGVRTISWPLTRKDGDKRFMLNGKPVFINGTCEYEHEFGQSHAFSNEQIDARVKEIEAAGFNAFRDAHQPHNLRYNAAWDKDGILWWPQFSAHIWFDTPQFRENFKSHLVQWVKERRNSPSIILWGLQNESSLPGDFARECSDIIRSLDPTCGTMRLVTTCNGGDGTDWNVVQNWSGTYGGNADNYGNELKRDDQLLNGEYGAWRTIGNHSGMGYTEEKFCTLLDTKIRRAEDVRDSVCGHFQWVFASHDNPGRTQPDEALRRIDKVGPFNYKGLLTPWEQPTDAYFLYKSYYVSASKEPFVYIIRDGKNNRYYSNVSDVRLHNDDGTVTADAYVEEKIVASDRVSSNNRGNGVVTDMLRPADGFQYVYRLNCGGDNYIDEYGHQWMQDTKQWSSSWTSRFSGMSPYLASQIHASSEVVGGTNDWSLFRTMRFGRHLLRFRFPVSAGDYRVELYFMEPWCGVGGGASTDAEGERLFDVAVNGQVVLPHFDIWANAGFANACKRIVNVHSDGGDIDISFPRVYAGQAVISAIAIATKNGGATKAAEKSDFSWTSFDNDTLVHTPNSLLPPRTSAMNVLKADAVRNMKKGKLQNLQWDFTTGIAKIYTLRFRYKNPDSEKRLNVKFVDAKGIVLLNNMVTFVQSPKNKWRTTSTTTGSYVNAGKYKLIISGEELENIEFDKLTVE
jgi:hypothetical protein